jgi:AraC-like DNA-binding protein
MVAELEQIPFDDGRGFRAGYINDKGGYWHFHPEYELVLNTKSYGTRIIGDNVELFDQYDMIFIAGNIPHCWNHYKVEGKVPEDHGIIVHFTSESFGENFLNQHEMHGVRKLLDEAERGVAFSVEDARKAEKHLVDMVSHSGIDKMIDFFCVLRIMSTADRHRQLCSENYKMTFDEHGNQRMTDVYTFIRENFNKHISLKEISHIANMSPFAFSRYFKKYSGAGVVEYINQVRTNKACYLLRETEHQVHNIAIDCGFKSISNFYKQFKKTVGISPRDYREQYNLS